MRPIWRGGIRAHGWHRAAPQVRDTREQRIELSPAAGEVHITLGVVVLPGSDREPEDQAPLRQPVDACGLLCKQRVIAPQRGEQDRAGKADPLGHRGHGRERDQRLVVAVDDPIDDSERGEVPRLSSLRPLDDALVIDAGDGRG
jgi:hypothetical protein